MKGRDKVCVVNWRLSFRLLLEEKLSAKQTDEV
jgi:hypothetical protein